LFIAGLIIPGLYDLRVSFVRFPQIYKLEVRCTEHQSLIRSAPHSNQNHDVFNDLFIL